jgi:3-methyladenine DNA glycosylase AlkD
MDAFEVELTRRLTSAFAASRDPAAAAAMSAYMRNQFPFLGIPSPTRAQLQREAFNGLPAPSEARLLAAATALWALEEREYQYAASALLARYAKHLSPASLPEIRVFITTRSWWDTVDTLASHVVGTMVAHHPPLALEIDRWIEDENLWVIRTAILHQLRFKSKTDSRRLFRYCERQAPHPGFFIRKAIGWALREYSKTDAAAVREFVGTHEQELSPLSRREALLWLNGGRKKRA